MYFEKLIRPRYLESPPDAKAVAGAMRNFRDFAAVLDGHLEHRMWLLGDRISYADFRVGTPLPFAEGAELPVADYPNIVRWNAQLQAIDAWRDPFAGL